MIATLVLAYMVGFSGEKAEEKKNDYEQSAGVVSEVGGSNTKDDSSEAERSGGKTPPAVAHVQVT